MYCGTCGKQIPDHSAFCPICGAKQNTVRHTSGDFRAKMGSIKGLGTSKFTLSLEAIVGSVLVLLSLLLFNFGWIGFDSTTELTIRAGIAEMTTEDYEDAAAEFAVNLPVVKKTFNTLKDGRLSPGEVKTIAKGIKDILNGVMSAAGDSLEMMMFSGMAKDFIDGISSASFIISLLVYGTYIAAILGVFGLVFQKRWSIIPFAGFVIAVFVFCMSLVGKAHDLSSGALAAEILDGFPIDKISLKFPAYLCMMTSVLGAAVPFSGLSKRFSFSGIPVNIPDKFDSEMPNIVPKPEPVIPKTSPEADSTKIVSPVGVSPENKATASADNTPPKTSHSRVIISNASPTPVSSDNQPENNVKDNIDKRTMTGYSSSIHSEMLPEEKSAETDSLHTAKDTSDNGSPFKRAGDL